MKVKQVIASALLLMGFCSQLNIARAESLKLGYDLKRASNDTGMGTFLCLKWLSTTAVYASMSELEGHKVVSFVGKDCYAKILEHLESNNAQDRGFLWLNGTVKKMKFKKDKYKVWFKDESCEIIAH